MSDSSLARCRVVLVRPHFPGNLGAAARVMRNFGLRELVLVDPIAEPESLDAVMMAVHGLDVLKAARRAPTLAVAVAECGFVIATSGEVGGLKRKGFWGTPEEKLPALLDALDRAPAALVFGPEPHGLTVEEIGSCHGMIFIPAADEYPSLNLAQAVAVCLYELRKQWLKRTTPAEGLEPPAPYEEQEQLFAHLREGLAAIRYLWDERADGVFHVLRQVVTRAMPTRKELKILHALAKQLQFVAKRWGVPHPKDHPHTRDLKDAPREGPADLPTDAG